MALLTAVPIAQAQPSAADAMKTYRTVETWIHTAHVPTDPQPLDPPGTTGASVTLRFAGRVMGRAAAVRQDGASVWEAARRAWVQALQRLPVEHDALREETLLALAPRVMIDLQLASVMTPIIADTLSSAAQSVAPGRQGVAARIGARVETVFPGFMLSTNKTPAQGLSIAIGALGLPPAQSLHKLQRNHELVLYRFDVQHLAQRAEGKPPVFLTRGGRITPLSAVTPDNLRHFGDRLATNLINRQWPGEEPHGLMGAYNPPLDTYDKPRIAPPFEQALAAFALARWSMVSSVPKASREKAIAEARVILTQLAQVTPEETPIGSDVAASSMLTLANLTLAQHARSQRQAPAQSAPNAAAPISMQRDTPPIQPEIAAVRAYAHALNARVQNNRELRALAIREVRALFADAPPAQLPSLMPWLGLAELTLLSPEDRVPAAIALREFRDLVEDHQLSQADVGASGDDDFVGGIVFTKGAAKLPSWQSIRPLIFLSTMLGDDRLTPPKERAKHLLPLLNGLRFVMQLTIDEAGSGVFPSPQRVVGGVRLSLWDQRQPVQTTAMALLLVAETLDSVDTITASNDH